MQYACLLRIPFIYGGTPESERARILGTFRVNPLVNCIGLSKVGDTSIDIPEANVIIQASLCCLCLSQKMRIMCHVSCVVDSVVLWPVVMATKYGRRRKCMPSFNHRYRQSESATEASIVRKSQQLCWKSYPCVQLFPKHLHGPN